MRNDAQHRRLERALHVVNRLHAGIEIFNEEGQTDAHDQADDDAEDDVQRFVGLDRGFRPAAAGSVMVTMVVLGISRSSLFRSNLAGKQLVEISHVFQLAFLLPIRLALLGFRLVLWFGVLDAWR